MKLGEALVDLAQHVAPTRLLVDLVDEQRVTAALEELCSELHQIVVLEEEVVHVDVETLALPQREVLPSVLEQQRGLTYTSETQNADKAVVPVNFINKLTAHRGADALYKVLMSTEKGF